MGCLIGILGFSVGLGIFLSGEPELGIIVIVGSGGVFHLYELWQKNKRVMNRNLELENELESLNRRLESRGITPSQIFQDEFDVNKHIVIDEIQKKVVFVNDYNSIKAYDYKDILQSKVLEDGREVLQSSRTGAVTGAVIGGALAGGVGAVIGGLAGARDGCLRKSITVKVIVNDTAEPSFEIEMLYRDIKNHEDYVDNESDKYINAYKKAQTLHELISVLIKKADDEEKLVERRQGSTAVNDGNSSMLLADEIRKLAELMKEGLITSEEFEKQKEKLLS